MPKTKFRDLSKFQQENIIVKLKSSLDKFDAIREYYLRPSPQLYHNILVRAEYEIVNPEHHKRLHRIIIRNVLWKPKELECFFTALERCGKHNPAEISRRLGTKSVSQVIILIEFFEHELKLVKACPVNYTDIPSAREMSDNWLEFEKIQVEMIQERINKIEKKETVEENMQPISKWDEKKHTTDDPLVNRASIITLYSILQSWLQGIFKNLIALDDLYKRTYIQENHEACSIITKYDIYRALKINGYKLSKPHNSDSTDEDDDLIEISESQYMSNLFDKKVQEGYYSSDYDEDNDNFSDNMQVDVQQTNSTDQILRETSKVRNNNVFDDTDDSRYQYNEDDANYQMISNYDNKIELKEQKIDKLYEKAFLRLFINPTDAESTNISNEMKNLEILFDTGLMRYNKIFDETELEDLLDSDKLPQHHDNYTDTDIDSLDVNYTDNTDNTDVIYTDNDYTDDDTNYTDNTDINYIDNTDVDYTDNTDVNYTDVDINYTDNTDINYTDKDQEHNKHKIKICKLL
ncbi:23735_t:CDS:2 [Gigaspora margarita]|uniref:23735_t:CDS:1 n=1 Tax=Gigaspora margarita TaxID=4874 RepID=A0ABN7UCS4_GIGMA|nr:23735_t:CDS:2 [Gigaspora margarita]